MRKIPILWKVTIWYTIFLCILAVMVVSVTYLVSDRINKRVSKSHLISSVEDVANELEYDDGVLEADDEINFLDHGVYLSVYDDQNRFLLGMVPKNYHVESSYSVDQIEEISIQQEKWYVYEKHQRIDEYGIVQIRGMIETMAGSENQSVTTRVLLFMSPVIILIATTGGYLLTKHAFKPIDQMRRTVEQINSGKDLTRRVNLGEGEDEIYKLGRTFDQMFERLEEAFEREKQFTSDVSHELRTPVSVILAQCEYAMEQNNQNETNEALERIYHQTQRMSKMIGQLLILSRSDQGFVKLHVEMLDISEMLEVIVEEANEKASKKNIMIYTQIGEKIVMKGDETMLIRFFVNLINNAICYGKNDGWIKVVLQREDQKITGWIEDNGIGIAKEEQEKIWRRFYQIDPSRTVKEDGNMGLGLSMVRWIANAHGGKVWLTSELGKGSRFSFWFPEDGPSQE